MSVLLLTNYTNLQCNSHVISHFLTLYEERDYSRTSEVFFRRSECYIYFLSTCNHNWRIIRFLAWREDACLTLMIFLIVFIRSVCVTSIKHCLSTGDVVLPRLAINVMLSCYWPTNPHQNINVMFCYKITSPSEVCDFNVSDWFRQLGGTVTFVV